MKSDPESPIWGTAIPADLAALWGAFLFEGLLVSTTQPDRARRVLDAWNQGCVELVWQSCSFLPEVWRQVGPHWQNSSQGFPGVFEYEVISELGTLLGDQVLLNDGQLPELEKVRGMIRVQLADFFSRGSPPEERRPT